MKHDFLIGLSDDTGTFTGAQCSRCGQIVLCVNGKVPEDIRQQECKKKSREDVNQAAARIVREATEN